MLSSFLHDIAGDPADVDDGQHHRRRRRDGFASRSVTHRVICGLSGGVDSSVVAALLHRAIGDQLTCVFVDHGMLRHEEAEEVIRVFRDQFHVDLVHVEAAGAFLELLAGVTDPEEKRRIIGEEFWKVFFEEAAKLEGVQWLALGTLYPDVIESGTSQGDGQDQEPSQPHPVPRRCALRSHRAVELAVQRRGACGRSRARPAGRDRSPSAVPGPGSGGSHHRRDHAREARHAPKGGRDRARRDLDAGTRSARCGSTSPCCPTSAASA